jgi:hypothetical protein
MEAERVDLMHLIGHIVDDLCGTPDWRPGEGMPLFHR